MSYNTNMETVEQLSSDPTFTIIHNTIDWKKWYKNDDEGAFSWSRSKAGAAELLASALGIKHPKFAQLVGAEMERAFSPDSLVMIEGNPPKPFVWQIDKLTKTYGIPFFAFTEGDRLWQPKKMRLCRISSLFPADAFICKPKNKTDHLLEVMQGIKANHAPNEILHIYFVDDKQKNADAATHLKTGDASLHAHGYALTMDQRGNAAACYAYLQEQFAIHAKRREKVALILDVDGVIIATDMALTKAAIGIYTKLPSLRRR